jgi:hypothetical protein
VRLLDLVHIGKRLGFKVSILFIIAAKNIYFYLGDDPATDLRGVGMLGLVQLLYFVKKYTDLARKIHKLSRDERQVFLPFPAKFNIDTCKRIYAFLLTFVLQCFPFSVVSLNFTKVILQAMRSGVLTDKFNKRGHVLLYMNEVLVGMHYELFLHWYVPSLP